MFRINVITLFPEIFPGSLDVSIISKARKNKIWDLKATNIKDFVSDKKRIDDVSFGGGPGMIMKAEILQRAYDQAVKSFRKENFEKVEKIMLTPSGEELNQEMVYDISKKNGLILVCGRYEGVDERFIEKNKLRKISIGKYVLSGGEVAAMVLSEAVIRLLPNVLGNVESKIEESFNEGLLEYPQYTKPRVWNGLKVPEILFSGNHENIKKWRKNKSIILTKKIKKKIKK